MQDAKYERCPFFPKETPGLKLTGLRECKLVKHECHFAEQLAYENCKIYQAYEKGLATCEIIEAKR